MWITYSWRLAVRTLMAALAQGTQSNPSLVSPPDGAPPCCKVLFRYSQGISAWQETQCHVGLRSDVLLNHGFVGCLDSFTAGSSSNDLLQHSITGLRDLNPLAAV